MNYQNINKTSKMTNTLPRCPKITIIPLKPKKQNDQYTPKLSQMTKILLKPKKYQYTPKMSQMTRISLKPQNVANGKKVVVPVPGTS
jgi:hypothetical protein